MESRKLREQIDNCGVGHGDPEDNYQELMDRYIEETVLWFGKYRGRRLKEVAKFDPSYVEWCAQRCIIPSDIQYVVFDRKKYRPGRGEHWLDGGDLMEDDVRFGQMMDVQR